MVYIHHSHGYTIKSARKIEHQGPANIKKNTNIEI